MKKKLVLFTFFAVTLFSFFAVNITAQKPDLSTNEQPLKECSGEKFVMPQSLSVNNEVFANFIKVMSLPLGERQKSFSDLSNEEKANIFKVQMALQFIKRPNLTKEQKDLILDTISKTSADSYIKENGEKRTKALQEAENLERRANSIFSPNDAYTIFASLSGEKKDIELLQKYENLMLFSFPSRKKTFRTLSPFEKSQIWKAQMVYFLATSKFSKTQIEFFPEIISLSTEKAFNLPSGKDDPKNDESKLLDSLEEKAFKLFSKEEVFIMFMSIGKAETISPINSPTQDLAPAPVSDCSCRWFCGPCYTCSETGCDETRDGCGWRLGSPCTGRCIFVPCP